jgi:hypothetical protein
MPKPNAARPAVQPIPASSNPPVMGWIVLIAIIAFVVWGLRLWQPSNNDQKQDHQQQVIDQGDKQPPSPNQTGFKDCVLIVVMDKKAINESLEYTLTMQNDQFWRVYAPSVVQNVEFLSDGDDAGKTALAAAKLPSPVVMLFNAKSKKLVWSIPLPKGSTSEIERRLK